jgi:hypothetical protein
MNYEILLFGMDFIYLAGFIPWLCLIDQVLEKDTLEITARNFALLLLSFFRQSKYKYYKKMKYYLMVMSMN